MDKNIINDISLLYELSLSIGQSLDLQENSDSFLKMLIARKNLDYGSVWIKGKLLSNQSYKNNFYYKVYSTSKKYDKEDFLPLKHPIVKHIQKKELAVQVYGDTYFDDFITETNIESGIYVVFSLGDIGFIKLYSSKVSYKFSKGELNKLWRVIQQFTISINACLYHLKSIQETERRAKIEKWIDQVNDGIQVVDIEGNFVFVNQEAADRIGYTVEELLEKRLQDIENRFKDDNIWENFLKEVKSKGQLLVENNITREDNTSLIVEVSIKYIELDNEAFIVSFSRDITQRKQQEQELRIAKNRAEEASKAKEQFLANVSHEIRTPMNAIVGMSELLNKTKLDIKQTEYLEAIQISSKNLLVIINDILDMSKIEAGKMLLEKVGFNLKKLIHNLCYSIRYKADEKGIGLFYEIDRRISPILIGDPTRLNQVLLNLATNAIKFTEDGIVEIEASLIEKDNQSNKIEFKVIDTGKGIDENKLNEIFESFTQEDETIARNYGGTGLGLSISKQLVSLFGGDLQVESKKSTGTTFSFVIDLTIGERKDLPERNSIKSDSFDLKETNILLAEDHDLNQLLAKTILEEWNANVHIVNNGKKALKALTEQDFDIILMDIQMPVMGGIEATKIIRNQVKSNIPIIALTANAIKGDSEVYLKAGMNDYLSKPFEPLVLFEKIVQFTSNQKTKILKNNINIQSILEITPQNHTQLPYNLNNLSQLVGGDESMIKNIVELFIKKTPELLIQLEDSYQKNNLKNVGRLAHKLKSSIEMMDIISLKETIRFVENEAKQGNYSTDLDNAIHKLIDITSNSIHLMEEEELLLHD